MYPETTYFYHNQNIKTPNRIWKIISTNFQSENILWCFLLFLEEKIKKNRITINSKQKHYLFGCFYIFELLCKISSSIIIFIEISFCVHRNLFTEIKIFSQCWKETSKWWYEMVERVFSFSKYLECYFACYTHTAWTTFTSLTHALYNV